MHAEQRLDDYIASEMRRKHIPGVSLAVITGGATVTERWYGRANVELEVPVGPETVSEIFSITKAFTATAIMFCERRFNRDCADESSDPWDMCKVVAGIVEPALAAGPPAPAHDSHHLVAQGDSL